MTIDIYDRDIEAFIKPFTSIKLPFRFNFEFRFRVVIPKYFKIITNKVSSKTD